MRSATRFLGVVLVAACTVAVAQAPGGAPAATAPPIVATPPAAAPAPAPPAPQIAQFADMFMEMGMEREQALMMAAMMSEDIDPGKLMLLMAMMGDNGMGGDAMGFLMFSQMMGRAAQATELRWFREGDFLFVIDKGVLSKIHTGTMKVEAQVQYATRPDQAPILRAVLQPLLGGARAKAEQTSCQSNLKQLALAFLMYAQDHQQALPGEDWAKAVFGYTKNEAVFRCPSRANLPVGYALNDKLLGATMEDVKGPGETVLLFETAMGGESPVGNAPDVPEEGVHNAGINAAFVDGHVKWVTVAEARRLLAREIDE